MSLDLLGGHQFGGRGCVACHPVHYTGKGTSGDELFGEDMTPLYGKALNFATGDVVLQPEMKENSPRLISGVGTCLSCHDGNLAKGSMMANYSFEQAAGFLPDSYGAQPIPTLLGDDGGAKGNYTNDHPVGQNAKLGNVGGGAISEAKGFFRVAEDSATGRLSIAKGSMFVGSSMEQFEKNYGLPSITEAYTGFGFAIDPQRKSLDSAYVVCTTCHNPHAMSTYKMNDKPYATFLFIGAPYNPGAITANGDKASSATQFCRQCHFDQANEAYGLAITTAF